MKLVRPLLMTALVAVAASSAWSQSYPSKPIRLIVPFAAGGTTDIVARVIADPLGRALGQPVIVDNRAGAGGVIGATEIARATPDGYVLGMATVSTVAASPAINPQVSYNPVTDFTPIINIAATPNVLLVHPRFPGTNAKTFLETIKKAPGQYSYATAGSGSIGNVLMELYKITTGTFITHIPYRGSGPALNDTVGGQVPVMFDNLPSALPFIKDKRLIPVMVAAPQRLKELPDVPTFKEAGVEVVNRMAFYGIHGPKGLPRETVDKINAAVRKVLEDPATRKRIEDTGSLVVANTPEQFAQQIESELKVYREVVKKTKIRPD